MAQQNNGKWMTVVAFSAGIALGAGTVVWMTQSSTVQTTAGNHETRYDQQFAQLKQAVTTLAQSLERNNSPGVRPEPTCATVQSGDTVTQQSLTKIIRDELRQALAQWTPDSQQARAQEIVSAQLRNSPENRAAYQSASDIVRTAVAAKRWTEEDRQTFREAMGHLTKEQHMELMELLLPAINRGEITVETAGPLF